MHPHEGQCLRRIAEHLAALSAARSLLILEGSRPETNDGAEEIAVLKASGSF